MESNEKKPKRPRINATRLSGNESNRESEIHSFERVNFNTHGSKRSTDYHQTRTERPYQPRNISETHSDNGYHPRPNTTYNLRNNTDYNTRNSQDNKSRDVSYSPRNNYNRTYGYTSNHDRLSDNHSDSILTHNYGSKDQNKYNKRTENGSSVIGYGNRKPRRNTHRATGNNPGFDRTLSQRPRPVIYETPLPDPNEQIRLNKFMANSGICSRREADDFIKQGLVKVNGEVVTELGTKITHKDNVEFDEKIVALENKTYILLNKPKDCVTTSDDPNGRLTVMDLVKGACKQRIYPVGRLDRNTTGVLLLTNDGDLASKLTHPKYIKKKIYHVWCDRDILEEDMQKIADGIELEDGPIHADAISYATEIDRNQAGIEIHSGQNRIVRRIFEKLGYHVTKLDRVYFAGLTKKNLPRGRWRYLTQQEVNMLKRGSFE